MRTRHGLGAGQRWLLACLCLLASLAYLARGTGPSGVTLGSPFQAVGAPGVQRGGPVSGHAQAPGSDMDGMAMGHPAEATHGERAARAAPALTGAAPGAPPVGHSHAAHCPFCFTSAFALEADGAVLAQPGAPSRAWTGPILLRLHLAALRHADPRAPPLG